MQPNITYHERIILLQCDRKANPKDTQGAEGALVKYFQGWNVQDTLAGIQQIC